MHVEKGSVGCDYVEFGSDSVIFTDFLRTVLLKSHMK